MITLALFSALATFYFTMFITPGPNNTMLTLSGLKFGFFKTLPHALGIPLGHILQIGLTCFGLGKLFLIYPQIQFFMKILCFFYLLYLGWKMMGSFELIEKNVTGRPLKFYEASLFQFINPKAWSIAIAVASGFFPAFLRQLLEFFIFCSFVIWALRLFMTISTTDRTVTTTPTQAVKPRRS